MARKGNPISVRLDLNRSSDPSWFSDIYYGKLVYQDVNLRSYFGSIRPPSLSLAFGFRLGSCVIIHFPKSTFINFFIPRQPRRLKRGYQKRREDLTSEIKNELRSPSVYSLYPTPSHRYRTSRAFSPLDDLYNSAITPLVPSSDLTSKSGSAFRSNGFCSFGNGLSEAIPDGERSEVTEGKRRASLRVGQSFSTVQKKATVGDRREGEVRSICRSPYPSLNYSVMQYLLKTQLCVWKRHQTSLYLCRSWNKATEGRSLRPCRRKQEAIVVRGVAELLEKANFKVELNKATIGRMLEIILRKSRIPYGYNFYLNEVNKMRSFLSNRTKTKTFIESVKIQSIYQSASLLAQEISLKLRRGNKVSTIFAQIVKDIPYRWGVEGIRICCSGRLGGVEMSRTECGKYGITKCHVFKHQIDYASADIELPYGILGVKVWISYSNKKKGRAISETYKI
nr:ribosomal protein S3 [Acorus tatarinowii]